MSQTSRSSSAYPRRRAVTACQVCRARRTKCDQKKPRCSFCEKTGAECISDPTRFSTFDPASLTILERLDGLERKLDSIERGVGSAQYPATSGPVNESTMKQIPLAESLFPENLEAIVKWPVFQGLVYSLPSSPELSTPGTRLPTTTNPILGDELNASATQGYLDIFFSHVHTKNPILDETSVRRLVRRISIEGPGWDSESCLALLVCANGAITRPFCSASLSSDELQASTGRALFAAAQKRMGMVLDSAGVVEAQCLFFVGVYLMSFQRPYDAWRSFLQGLAVCQNFRFMDPGYSTAGLGGTGASAEESTYWSCWKSERELRLELGLPDFGSPSALIAPQRFPTLPLSNDDQLVNAWYFYLSEISLWRLEMEARKDMSACLSKMRQGQNSPDRLLDLLCEVSEIYSQQSVAWQDSLPSMVSISDTTCDGTGTDVLRFVLRGRKTYLDELITWPFIVHAVGGSELSPTACLWLSKGLEAHLERLEINFPGFHHRHHGTWLMIRSSARSACILLAIARSPVAAHLPFGWKEAVEKTINMLYFWCGEVAGLEDVAKFCQDSLDSF
ncbi:uncharacterized protein BDV17DRAFT_293436 [Aspergillus undulatus]|uniref:uncharacterized protein n=1 Tax=Aspergillus undulatus TaxID=1810928 RepID=UPI003CCD27E3